MNGAFTILLVEDDEGDAELTALALQEAGVQHKVVVVQDGAEALDLLMDRGGYANRDISDPPDLVLLDLKLPRVSGQEVLSALKADPRTRSIPVIILSSSSQECDLAQCYKLGANSYLQKPAELWKFRDMLRHFANYWFRVNRLPPRAAFPEGIKGWR